jgi:UDP-N-acetylglucosamine 4,6-dehydratase/5-epimerase
MFENKILLITGGTGSFGNAVLRRFLDTSIREIRIFSRDEKKQDDMRARYQSDKLRFVLGDVRDQRSVDEAVRGAHLIFHAAALKQVPSCEFYPLQAVQTNILGTGNVLEAAVKHGVGKVICLSTDKAVYPINAMGMSKALMEKVMVASARGAEDSSTVICGTRYGNVMASRGSVIPLFINQIRSNQPISITDPGMTRFMMSLDDAVELVLYAFEHGRNGEIFVQKAPASTVGDVADALKDLFGVAEHPVRIIGTRHGEKRYETLLTREEMAGAEDLGQYYRIIPDARGLNYSKYIVEGKTDITEAPDYNSHNTTRLDVEGTRQLLLKLPFIRALLAGEQVEPEG